MAKPENRDSCSNRKESFSENWLQTMRKPRASMELLMGESLRFSLDVRRLHSSSEYFDIDLSLLDLNRRTLQPDTPAAGNRKVGLKRKWWNLLWKAWRIMLRTSNSSTRCKVGADVYRNVCDSDSSISDAVLHCKQSSVHS